MAKNCRSCQSWEENFNGADTGLCEEITNSVLVDDDSLETREDFLCNHYEERQE